jgi:hypothetical protein
MLLLAMAIALLILRFLDPTGFIALTVLFLPVSNVVLGAGIPPLALVAPLLLAQAPFWLSHENFWVAMGEGMTSNQAFSAGQRVTLANVYGILVLVTLAISVGYWTLTGIL